MDQVFHPWQMRVTVEVLPLCLEQPQICAVEHCHERDILKITIVTCQLTINMFLCTCQYEFTFSLDR